VVGSALPGPGGAAWVLRLLRDPSQATAEGRGHQMVLGEVGSCLRAPDWWQVPPCGFPEGCVDRTGLAGLPGGNRRAGQWRWWHSHQDAQVHPLLSSLHCTTSHTPPTFLVIPSYPSCAPTPAFSSIKNRGREW
jgi:hypothetical protein